MPKVIKTFRDLETGRVYLKDFDVYVGDRVKELTEKGYLEAETKAKETPTKKATTKPKTTEK